ncbi:hypothetical protein C8R46DRAFT_1221947 [Mycena filopes]|nr:hypothetical protein C8R46DRAFT_1221947 [Mycena filopes]
MAMMERHHGQWSHRVIVGKYSAFEVPSNDIVITNISLGADLLGDEQSVLFVHHRILDAPPDGEKKTQAAAVACLTPGKVEFASIHLVLNRREPIAFEATGDNDIYLFGHYTSYNKLPSSSSYTASSFEGNSQVYSTQGSSVSTRPGQDGSASSQAGPVCDPHQTSSFAVDGVLAPAAVGCMLPTLTAQRKTPDLLHIETPLAQTPADDALDSPSAFAPHTLDIQSPKCLPLLGENGQNSPMCIAPARPYRRRRSGQPRLLIVLQLLRRISLTFNRQNASLCPVKMVKTHLCALPPPVRIVAGAAVNLDS